MRYVIMGVAAVFAVVNWLNSADGRKFKHHIQQEQNRHSQVYEKF
jgi:hypothetical protein